MKKIFCLIIILIVSIVSCNKNNSTNPTATSDGLTYPDSNLPKKDFKVLVLNSSGGFIDNKYNFYKIAEYDKLIIYVKEGSGYKKENVDYIANEFNKNYSEEVRIYGEHTDVDNNGKIIILLLELNEDYSGSVITGYFYRNDLLDGLNNNGEILYMDLLLVNENPQNMVGTIQHEFQHLINFNVNYIQNNKEISTWLNEALSESTSLLFSESAVNSRINEFNKVTYGYYCFYTWTLPSANVFPNNPNSQNLFANYPSVSVFMNCLYKKNNNPSVFQNIAKYSSLDDYQRVFNNVSFTSAASWDDLLLKWVEGLKNNDVEGVEFLVQEANSKVSLYPGAVVAYGGSLSSSGNLVTKDLSGGVQIALNKDTYVGDAPTPIEITTPNTAVSAQGLKTYKADKPYIPKYIQVLFDKDGNIKKY
ncbi:peptidase M30 [uncultured Brachyspira sp.]|uniref:peptidase M30 n=1 Tax=uncultured Brachyspira sp. TaxID=221953 RepID=UPI0026031727|nr:peptidase M30 [uncultured Brachyspira sp.]